MSIEIEKKYIIEKIPFALKGFQAYDIKQGYLSEPNADTTERLRQKGDKFIKTWKTKGLVAREETEIEIPKEMFVNEWAKVGNRKLEKIRYEIPYKSYLIELDIYKNDLEGLITAEVEFSSEKEMSEFIPPDWFGKDVTLDFRYKNSQLASNGLPQE